MIAPGAEHRFALRVYYEDVDLAGIVYYANCLRFIERARSEMLREAGIDQGKLRAETGLVFAVSRCEIDFRRPARFDDRLSVLTRVLRVGGARLELAQRVERTQGESSAETLAEARVVIACLGADGRPARLSGALRGGGAD